jgi:3-oxoacyl-[acyl-carrier protein] reductase
MINGRRRLMLLQGKTAVVYGAAGSVGGAVARAFAADGAHVHLAGRTAETLEAVAEEIRAAGGEATPAVVDAMDPESVEAHADEVVRGGSFDVSFNAIEIPAVQGPPMTDLSLDDFMKPVVAAARTHFVTGTAAARRMTAQGSGVIVTLSSTAAREARHSTGGFGMACASIEAFTRTLAGEVGPKGVRVVCLRPNFMPETAEGDTEATTAPLLPDVLLGRLPSLAELAGTAVFLASDRAGAMTATVTNLSCGSLAD